MKLHKHTSQHDASVAAVDEQGRKGCESSSTSAYHHIQIHTRAQVQIYNTMEQLQPGEDGNLQFSNLMPLGYCAISSSSP